MGNNAGNVVKHNNKKGVDVDNTTNAEEQLREAAQAQAETLRNLPPGESVPASDDIINALKDMAKSIIDDRSKIRVVVIKHDPERQEEVGSRPAEPGLTNLAVKVMAGRYDYNTGRLEPISIDDCSDSPDEFILGARKDAQDIGQSAVAALAEDLRANTFANSGNDLASPEANAYLRILMELGTYPKEVIASILGDMVLGCAQTLAEMGPEEYAEYMQAAGLR